MGYSLPEVAEQFEKHGFKTKVFNDKAAVIDWLQNDFAQVDSVGRGGSVTLDGLGFDEIMSKRGMAVCNHAGADPAAKRQIWQAAGSADAYFMSANAATADGKILNVDGAGNRVSAMTCGPKKVYYIIGRNKIVADLDAAHKRVQAVAAPKNVARLNLNTGCKKTGSCVDCNAERRICNAYVVLARAPWAVEESWVILVDEDMGY